MPGRRAPRRPPDTALNQHTRAAFLGGMDGASLIPYPVGTRRDQSANTKPLVVLFWNDEFYGYPGGMWITLTWMPILHSEHVYRIRNEEGVYLREEVNWTRDSGSRTINILAAAPVLSGDHIVVEYAYYEQIYEKSGGCS